MAYTISTHNGSKVSRQHNLRNRTITDKESHIKKDGIHETWLDESPIKAYRRIFGKAQDEYNARQRRNDRKILDYYQTVKKSATQHTVYEIIVQVGSKDNHPGSEISKSILKDYFDDWKKRNPNLETIGAYYHEDEEGAPHLHIDYIPVAHGYSRGMEMQAGLVRAYEEQGFFLSGRDTAQIKWERAENSYLDRLCRSRGLEITHPHREGVKHLDTSIYKKTQELEKQEQRAIKLATRNKKAIERIRNAESKATRAEERADQLDYDVSSYEAISSKYKRLRAHISKNPLIGKAILNEFDKSERKPVQEMEIEFDDIDR